MPYFQAMLHGHGFLVAEDQTAKEPIRGFYTTRAVKAADAEAARIAVVEELKCEKEVRLMLESTCRNGGGSPKIDVEHIEELSWIKAHWRRFGGYTFYVND